MSTITETVAERIAAISPQVNDKVVDHLVNLELDKRTNAIVEAMTKLRDLQNELKKFKPDLGGFFQEDGTEVKPTNYSKDKFDARKKVLDQIDKYEKALDLAIDKGDMSKLYDLKK